MAKPSVIAVIPAHNAAKTIKPLLDTVLEQKYDDVFVIDDASSDSTARIVKRYGPRVKLIEGEENVGAGANRNRIIGRIRPSIIHFIDSDMRLLSQKTPEIIRKLEWPDDTAFIGGMVRNPDGTQNPFNYGSRPHLLKSLFIGGLQYLIWQIGSLYRPAGISLKRLLNPVLRSFPDIYTTPRPRRIFWTSESNMLIRSDLFERHGGYDPQFRYSEIEDFALRMYRDGMHGRFEPRIDVMHDSRDNVLKSFKKRRVAQRKFQRKHGWLVYLIPPLADYLAGRKTQKRYHR